MTIPHYATHVALFMAGLLLGLALLLVLAAFVAASNADRWHELRGAQPGTEERPYVVRTRLWVLR